MHLGIDPDELTNPIAAGIASLIAFTVGGIAPLLTILLLPDNLRIPLTFAAVLVALAGTGYTSARVGYAPAPARRHPQHDRRRAAMAITYGIGLVVGTASSSAAGDVRLAR